MGMRRPTNMDTTGDAGAGGSPPKGGDKPGMVELNNLTYALEPDMSVAVNKTHKKHFFQSTTYGNDQSAIAILNSGAEYIDTRRSYLAFNVELLQPAGTAAADEINGFFGVHGSACNLIDTITISTRSGDEISRLTDFPLLMNMLSPVTFTQDWFDNQGKAMMYGGGIPGPTQCRKMTGDSGIGGEGDGASSVKVSIPLYVLSPFFAYGRLMPCMLMSGLRIEIKWNSAARAFLNVAATPQLQGTGGEANLPVRHPTLAGYTITDPYFSLCSIQLSDSMQRALNQQSATNGLEIVYTDFDKTPFNPGTLATNVHLEVRKSCSRALKAFARTRVSHTSVAEHQKDSYRAETRFPYIQYQWQLGSLYFPHQPIKSKWSNPAAPLGFAHNFDMVPESYVHLLESVDKYHPGAGCPPALSLRGVHKTENAPLEFYFGKDAVFNPIAHREFSAHIEFDANQLGVSDPGRVEHCYNDTNFGRIGSFANDQHTIGVNLERSSMFNLAGIPINNSRVLVFHATLSDSSNDILWNDLGASIYDPAPILKSANASRDVAVFLKYVKLARVWLNNVEVEQ